MKIFINRTEMKINFENNQTIRELEKILPIEVKMNELNSNEKFAYLTTDLPTFPISVNSISAGDMMLFGSNCLVIFYKSFTTSYQYTPIGHIDNVDTLKRIFEDDFQTELLISLLK